MMLHHSWLQWMIVALATFRLVRLVTRDRIAAPLRTLGGRAGMKWTDFVTCPWCVGFWISLGVIVASLTAWHLVKYLWIVLALSAIVGLIAERS